MLFYNELRGIASHPNILSMPIITLGLHFCCVLFCHFYFGVPLCTMIINK